MSFRTILHFMFWLFKVHSTRMIRHTWSPAEGDQNSKLKISTSVLSSDRPQTQQPYREAQAMARSWNGKDIRDSFFLKCKWFSHPMFLCASPLRSTSLLYMLTPKPCSFLNLTTKLSGWALRIKSAPSQPCSFIVIATERIISFIVPHAILTSSLNYLSYFKDTAFISPKIFDPNNLQGAERWPPGENFTPPEKVTVGCILQQMLMEWDRRKLRHRGSTSSQESQNLLFSETAATLLAIQCLSRPNLDT